MEQSIEKKCVPPTQILTQITIQKTLSTNLISFRPRPSTA